MTGIMARSISFGQMRNGLEQLQEFRQSVNDNYI